MKASIHQIYYSEATRAANDPGFVPMDNLANERPDWSEYWPIRRFLRNASLDEECGFGFLSPKFRQKTGLGADEVHRFVAESNVDVVLFSPFFDQSAFFINVFEQATAQQAGLAQTLPHAMRLLAPGMQTGALVMSSLDSVFCNYFVAKPRFWKRWIEKCEILFDLAERADTDLGRALDLRAAHISGPSPAKVFVVERVASLLLATTDDFKVRAYNPMRMPFAAHTLAPYAAELCRMDALKIAHKMQPCGEYLAQFCAIRTDILERANAAYARRTESDPAAAALQAH